MSVRFTAVLGLGLIGGSIAARLRQAGHSVCGYDVDQAHARRALDRGLVDTAASTVSNAVRDADIVVLAAPVGAILTMLPQVDALAGPNALILDVGSVKRAVVQAMNVLPGAYRMVGGHPLAGDERSGPDVAWPDLFQDKRFVLCPTEQSEPSSLERAEQLVHTLGAVPVVLAAAEHDRALARTSHLPQVLSSALALSLSDGDLELSGSGLRDMTRLASSDPTIWRDILLANSDEVVAAIRRCASQLNRVSALMQLADADGVSQFVESGRERMGGAA